MILVELVKEMDGESVGTLLSPVVPETTVVLTWGDEEEVWHVEDVLDMKYRLDAPSGLYELALVRVSVTRSRFGGGAVKV